MIRGAYQFEATVPDLVREDSGVHLVAYGLGDERCPLYVHLLSEAKNPHAPGAHSDLLWLDGRRIRVTIDILD